jgi:hypothetical protein
MAAQPPGAVRTHAADQLKRGDDERDKPHRGAPQFAPERLHPGDVVADRGVHVRSSA